MLLTIEPDISDTLVLPDTQQITHRILLADDDLDDCLLFKEALEELGLSYQLTNVHNGEQLMKCLKECEVLPDILFLDLNMPRKNGFQCLSEIKESELLRSLPVIIVSTSYEQRIINLLYDNGSMYYLRKPNDFSKFKRMIDAAIALSIQKKFTQPSLEEYVLFY